MQSIIQKRITDDEALNMLEHMPTAELMARANEIQRKDMEIRYIMFIAII